ncbi:MAG: type II toxin-antitoxin system death-on-curing family toxin [Methanothrix soehngenii]|jgi:death-on-curing protein|nr:type II toxin-antitoxin system death-on-curing family toxin [Methanothrix soehngenii]
MEELTEEKVKQVHDFLIEETGGLPGIRDQGTLYFSVEAVNREVDLFRKAAQALFLAERHPFWDGQKRTAFELADLILRQNGYRFDRSDRSEIVRVMVRIAEYSCPEGEEIDTIVKWVKRMVVRLE